MNAVSDAFRALTKEELNPAELRNRFGISRDYILAVGNLQTRKNMVRLIRAYRSLREWGKITRQLVIVGKKAWMFNGCV